MKEYQYPLDLDWTTDEMIRVTAMWSALEEAYEKGIATEAFLTAYDRFKQVVKSLGEERRLGREFEQLSGYSLYQTVKTAKQLKTGRLKMKGR